MSSKCSQPTPNQLDATPQLDAQLDATQLDATRLFGIKLASLPRMTRPIRFQDPDSIQFITNRTLRGLLLLRPSKRVNDIIGGVLARAVQKYGVQLFAFIFASNHFHLLARAPAGVLPQFMGYLESNLARKLAPEVDWSGPFWHRRYSAEPVLDNEALLDRLKYILAHGVKEGLVNHPDEWPGLTCIPELRDGEQRQFPWYNWTQRYIARLQGKTVTEADICTYYPLQLTPLPCFADSSCDEVSQFITQMLDVITKEVKIERGDKPALGVQHILDQHPHDRPLSLKRSPRPLCHTSCRVLRAQFKIMYRNFVQAYREASQRFRAGNTHEEFPMYAFRPPLPHTWCPT